MVSRFGSLDRKPVGMRRQKDDRDVHLTADVSGCLHAVFLSPESDIHQNEIDVLPDRDLDTFLCGIYGGNHPKAHARKALPQFFRNQSFVFDDESTRFRGDGLSVHDSPP